MKLSKDFSIDRYGLHVRYVTEEDADFIVNLRTDPRLGMFLNPTENDIQKQIDWIREYKKREATGSDYYFIYIHKGQKIGVNRIYNIIGNNATSGSWICSPNLPFELPLLTVVIIREIFFEILELKEDIMDTRRDNKKVIKMHHLLGAIKIGENEIDVFHSLTRENFLLNKAKFLKFINIKPEKQI